MKTCPACKERIKGDATRCAYCQTSFSAADIASGEAEQKNQRAYIWVIGFVAFLLVIYWLDHGGAEEAALHMF
ncbi:zinc ribbon domain-containing protein [Stakelama pacifica]|uniref:Uncharacterized protein UPF0547 n=1 Tax=Stakelama pacifica TaxID=517720 RepID=A0A4R6FJY4_9SPHN|nr:zinc ribbon domain-containing protein [Stakelama pacifica]TDN81789.1 uncharacterized protein UPF0547 [Stakelama pacifica]GGO96574.1 hypothetical protein GCM10011329_23420 [Stakelama pacifica]